MTLRVQSGGSAPVQRGFAMIALLALAALIAAFLIASGLNITSAGNSNEREDRSMSALRKAKTALIAYAANEQWQLYKGQATDQPGGLPCPDTNDNGTSQLSCPNAVDRIGRLPYMTIGADDLRDASGERLWYAMSSNFRRLSGTTIINSDTQGLLTVTGDAPASNVVAIVFAPGNALSGQDRIAQHNLPAAYLEGFTAASPDYTFTSVATPSLTANDRLLVITQAELMAAVEPVVAARIERDVKPLIQSYFGIWGFYPFAVPFAGGPPALQSAYLGVPGQSNGLMPLTSAPFTWLNSAPDFITVTEIAGGTGVPTNPTWTCSGGVNLVCTIQYSGGSGDRPAIQLQGILSGPTTSFADGPASTLVGSLSMIDGNSNTTTWSSSSPTFTPTTNIAVQAKGLVATYTGRLRNPVSTAGQVTITVPGITNYLPIQSSNTTTNPTGAWFVANQWYRQTYYAISTGFAPGGVGSCNSVPAPPTAPITPSCLMVKNLPPSYATSNDKRAILVFAGRELNGLTPRPANLANYLESANLTAANGTTPFVYEHRAGVPTTINDRVVVVSP